MSPSPILSPSDEKEERLLTQPPDAEADKAEAIDLTVESEACHRPWYRRGRYPDYGASS